MSSGISKATAHLALIDLRIANTSAVDAPLLEPLIEELRSRYPTSEPRHRMEARLEAQAGKAPAVQTQDVGFYGLKLTNPARTVVDCFKYRNKIGLDVALEALRECRCRKDCKIDDIWKYATLQRVARVMKPCLEILA